MFDFFKKRESVCYSLINTDEHWEISDELILDLTKLFSGISIPIKDFRATNEKYIDSKITSKIPLKERYVYLFHENENQLLNVYIAIGRPHSFNLILIEVGNKIDIDYHKIIYSLRDCFIPDYGISYTGRFDNESFSYLLGENKNHTHLGYLPKYKIEDFQRWFVDKLQVSKGFLRDIYLQNILTNNHLNKSIGNNLSLKMSIEKNDKMGILEKVYENCFLWKIEAHNINYVKDVLKNQNFFI